MFKRIESFISNNRAAVSTGIMSAMFMLFTFAGAAEGDVSFDLGATMTTAAQKIVTDLLAMISAVLPVCITLFAAVIGITKAMQFIKKLIGKAG